MSTTPATSPLLPFTGISQYASDFQSILAKAVQVAQIPVTQLQSQDSNLLEQKTLLGSLESSVSDLDASLTALAQVGSSEALSASSSDSSVVSVISTSATTPASYTINSITSAASAASERSNTGYVDAGSTPVSATGTVTLQIGSTTKTFTLTNNNLTSLRDQINGLGLGVTASILTTSSGNYLTVSATSTGATTLKLFDGSDTKGTDLLTNTNQGSNAVFQLNGINVSQAGNVVNSVIPGVTFTIQGSSTSPVTLSLSSDPTQLSSALQDFVAKYNALMQQIGAQVGIGGGALAGDTIINQLQNTMRQITSFTMSGGTVQSLADLGVQFSNTGVASFDPPVFDSLTSRQISDGFKFVSGLGSFKGNLSAYDDPVSGEIKNEENGIDRTDQSIQTQITTLNDRISAMQTSMTSQLEAADALQAELQSQQNELAASLQGLSLVLYGKNLTRVG